MSVYARFKRMQNGFRQLVELLEITPISRRQKMIEVGMAEDPDYTERALKLCLNFEDILKLPEPELAELVAKAAPKTTAASISPFDEATKMRFIKCAPPRQMAEIRDLLENKLTKAEIGGAQLKMVATARELEKNGYIKTKRIPT